jgi:hypothetical protein
MSSISSISIYITSASFYLIISSSSAIYLATSSLACSNFYLLYSSTLAFVICSYYFKILCLISFSYISWCWYIIALFLCYALMNLLCLASSCLCIIIASYIFFLSFSLYAFIWRSWSLWICYFIYSSYINAAFL